MISAVFICFLPRNTYRQFPPLTCYVINRAYRLNDSRPSVKTMNRRTFGTMNHTRNVLPDVIRLCYSGSKKLLGEEPLLELELFNKLVE